MVYYNYKFIIIIIITMLSVIIAINHFDGIVINRVDFMALK